MISDAGIILSLSTPRRLALDKRKKPIMSRLNLTALALITLGYCAIIAVGVIARVEPARQALLG